MEPILCELKSGAEATLDMPHEGQEFGYILEGSITIVYGNYRYICKKGETFYFTTDKNHYIYIIQKKLQKLFGLVAHQIFRYYGGNDGKE